MSQIADKIAGAAAMIGQASYAVALTGAGISTPSGIPDFRSPRSGMWEQANPLQVASLPNFMSNPASFYDWIRPLTRQIMEAQPNSAHIALAELENMGLVKAIITQNIDLLHSRAGSQIVFEVHGHVRECTCVACYKSYQAEPFLAQFIADGKVPKCPACNQTLKPNVVLFGEELPIKQVIGSQAAIRNTDLVIVVGSSLEVFPVADLPRQAQQRGAKLIIINYGHTYLDTMADIVIHANVAEVLPAIVAELKNHE